MNRTVVSVSCALFILLSTGIALAADSMQGRIGVTGRIGILVPADSDAFDPEPLTPGHDLETDVGFIGGGGLIFGLTKNVALEFELTYTEFGAKISGVKEGDFDTTNISLGAHYRFVDTTLTNLVPYVGGGVDILVNGFSSSDGDHLDVDTVAGVHVRGGIDYFLLKQLALNAEVKGVLAPDADILFGGEKVGNYDPTSLSLTFGVRYFFH